MIAEAEANAEEILDDANRLIEKTIKDIRESKAEKNITKKLRETISEKKEKLGKKRKIRIEKRTVESRNLKRPFNEGDSVKMLGQTKIGLVAEIKAEKALVVFEHIKIRVPLHQLEHSKKTGKQIKSSNYSDIVNNLNKRAFQFDLTLDVRGHKTEEALRKTSHFIDEAILLSITEVRIIHGKGYGILRQQIRKYLANRKEIEKHFDEHIEQGGHGVTIILLK